MVNVELASSQQPAVIINEFSASNTNTIVDEDGDSSDWIELLNTASASVSLEGWRLVDSGSSWVLPAVTLGGGQTKVIWASGKDRSGTDLHTNFKLKSTGEYLGLLDNSGQIMSEYSPSFPPQRPDRSWGHGSNNLIGFLDPTPDKSNGPAVAGQAQAVGAQIGRGTYFTDLDEQLSTSTANSTIRYTLDGSPVTESSDVYQGPISIGSTTSGITTIRARTYAPGLDPSNETSWSYVFPAGRFPDHPATYQGFSTRPIVSIHTDDGLAPDALKRHASLIEFIDPDPDRSGFSSRTGVRWVGDSSPINVPKPSLRLYWEPEFGESKLDYPVFEGYEQGYIEPTTEFSRLDLRGGSHDAFVGSYYLSDRFFKDAQLDMGGLAPHGRYVSLFVNGVYQGAYNMRERADHNFYATYGNHDASDYESTKMFTSAVPPIAIEPENGDGSISEAIAASAAYSHVKDMVGDPTNLALLMATEVVSPMGQCEYRALVPIDPDLIDPALFLRNDSDSDLSKGTSTLGLRGCLFDEFGREWLAEEVFVEAVRDALTRGFCPGGVLTSEALVARLDTWVDEIDDLMVAETERWGREMSSIPAARQRFAAVDDAAVLKGLVDQGYFDGCGLRPSLSALPNAVVLAGSSVTQQVIAQDPEGSAVTFSAAGLPTGLMIDPSTGTISGAPTSSGTWKASIRVTDSSGHWNQIDQTWTVLPAGVDQSRLVLNEYNAVSKAGTWSGSDPSFIDPQSRSENGGDWLEFVATTDVDLRGWSIEIWDRDRRTEELKMTHRFEFADNTLLASVLAGSIITISEDVTEDASYDPAENDWNINVGSSNTASSQLLTAETSGNFSTNRHEMRVLVRDETGATVGPFMGETETWRAQGSNVGGADVLALCVSPSQQGFANSYQDQQLFSTFGLPNRCSAEDGGSHFQSLTSLRGALIGDANCDTVIDSLDTRAILDHVVGLRDAGTDCLDGSISATQADINGDSTVNLRDAQTSARCHAGTESC